LHRLQSRLCEDVEPPVFLTKRGQLASLRIRMAENPRREAGNNKANEITVARVTLRSTADNSNPCDVDDSAVNTHPNAAPENPADDLDATAEFPVLVLDGALYASGVDVQSTEAEEDSSKPPLTEPPAAEERASFWLNHLESDIQRLKQKWESAAADLCIRAASVQELCGQVEATDALVDDLRRQIGDQANAQLTLKANLEQANARITDLLAAQATHDVNVRRTRSDLQEATEEIAAAETNRAGFEKTRFGETIDRDAAAAYEQGHYAEETDITRHLRARVAELETYIDGSKRRWSALHEKLAAYRDAQRVSERRAADAQARLVSETMSRDRLWTEADDLRRCLEQLGARLAEQERERGELERKLNEERAVATQLSKEVASVTARGDQALSEFKAREQRVADLELLVLARDETIAGLEQRLRARDRAKEALLARTNDLEGRAAALELEVGLAAEAGSQKERDFGKVQQKVWRLEGLLREAGREIDDLVTAIEAREETILSLEADLRASENVVATLESSARRLNVIDLSIKGLDRPRPRRH
jgi:chromosome segregation ATPase